MSGILIFAAGMVAGVIVGALILALVSAGGNDDDEN